MLYMASGHISYIRLCGQCFTFSVKCLSVSELRALAGRQDLHIAVTIITASVMLGFIDSCTLLEHHADLLFKTVCKLPDLCQFLTAEIVQTAESGNTVIIFSVAHFLEPDLYHTAIGRTAAEHKGLVHELTERL